MTICHTRSHLPLILMLGLFAAGVPMSQTQAAGDQNATPQNDAASGISQAKNPGKPAGKIQRDQMSLAQLPEAVRAAIKKEAGDAPLVKLEKETRRDGEIYTAKWGGKTDHQEIKVMTDGTVTGLKKVIPAADLPEPVKQAAKAALPQARLTEIHKNTTFRSGKEQVVYQVKAETDEGKHHLKFLPDGTMEERLTGPAKAGKAKGSKKKKNIAQEN